MKIFVVATRKSDASADDIQRLLGPESDHVLGLIKDDVMREVYSRADGKGAICVLECDSLEEAKNIIAELPLAKAGLLSADFYGAAPYRGIIRHAK